MKMKQIKTFLAAVLVVIAAFNLRAEPNYSFRFVNAEIYKVLEAYQALAGAKIVIASGITNLPAKITVEANSPTLAEAHNILEHALIDQAGIVVTRLKDGRVSVTYNVALHREANIRAVKPSNVK